MPTYEYECKSCSHNFEVFQAMSDPPLKDCPQCGKEVRRLIFGGAGVIFKGSGFYVTDKGKSAKGAAKPAGSSKAGSAASAPGPASVGVPASGGAKSEAVSASAEKPKSETKTA